MRFFAVAASLILTIATATATAAHAGEQPGARHQTATPTATTDDIRLPAIRLHGNALNGQPRSLSVDELDDLTAQTEWTIRDPYRQQKATYSGVRLRDFVQALAPTAQRVRMRSVSDAIAVFERREWETLPILLATRDNHGRMSVANKGPTRIVYQLTRDNELAMQVNAPKWIWQVVDVEFSSNP